MFRIDSRLAYLGGGFALAISTMALAQSYNAEFGTGNVGIGYMVESNGALHRLGGQNGRVNDNGDSMIRSNAQELPPGSVIYKKGNKYYSLRNQMIKGKNCPEWEHEWTR
jgi:hypothetical protein